MRDWSITPSVTLPDIQAPIRRESLQAHQGTGSLDSGAAIPEWPITKVGLRLGQELTTQTGKYNVTLVEAQAFLDQMVRLKLQSQITQQDYQQIFQSICKARELVHRKRAIGLLQNSLYMIQYSVRRR